MILHFMKYFVLAFIGSIAPAIVVNIEKRLLLWAGLGGALGYCVALLFNPYTPSFSISQIFIGTVIVGVYSELMARYLKAPATVFCIPGIFPFVPGANAYQTVQSLAENNLNQAAVFGLNTVFKAFTIAFGIMMVTAFFRLVRKKNKRRENFPPSSQ
jgi:uncharacterized membrane protein YjjB (DUF3815 family)